MSSNVLRDVDAYMFDVFGTTVDWFTTVKRQVARLSHGAISQAYLLRSAIHGRRAVLALKDQDAVEFAREWRNGYYTNIRNVNAGGGGSLNTDVAHRQVLDGMLASPRWSHLAAIWDEPARNELVQIWHDLDVYKDTIPGLARLSQSGIVIAMSNGNYRLLLDMAKNKQLPWDGILSTEFFGVYKPTAQAYLSAAYHLGIPPDRIAMVAAHTWDVEGAACAGLKTIYVPRPAEDTPEAREGTRSKAEGGTVDLVVRDFEELAALAAEARK